MFDTVAHQVAKPAADNVSDDGVTDRATDHESRAGWRNGIDPGNRVDHEQWTTDAYATPDCAAELRGPTQPVLGRQHENSSHARLCDRAGFRQTVGHGPCGAARR
jgi:hypothetical protein